MLLDRRRSYDFRQALKKTPLNRFLRRKSPSKKRLRIDRQITVLRVKKELLLILRLFCINFNADFFPVKTPATLCFLSIYL